MHYVLYDPADEEAG